MKRILCYGDSNTWGYISGTDHLRYAENKRWTGLLAKKLGRKYQVIEEGLNSRTLYSVDKRPGREGRVGFDYLKPCLDTHDKIDCFVLMLGTNEFKADYNNTAEQISAMLIKFIEYIKNYKSQIDKTAPKLILSGVALVNENTEYAKKDGMYNGATEKSVNLNVLMKKYCQENGVTYIDNTDLEVGVDGVHFTEQSHKILAQRIYERVK